MCCGVGGAAVWNWFLPSSQRTREPGRRTEFPAPAGTLRKQRESEVQHSGVDGKNESDQSKGSVGRAHVSRGGTGEGPEGQEVEPAAAPQPGSKGCGLPL